MALTYEESIIERFMDNSAISWRGIITDIVYSEGMNPWDIDISLLADRYIERIKALKRIDFKISGQIVVTASVLLRYKAKFLLEDEKEDEIEDEEEISAEDIEIRENEEVLKTIDIGIRRVEKRKVTIFELVDALQDALKKEKKKIQRTRAIKEPVRIEVEEENIDERKERIYHRIAQLSENFGRVPFSLLLNEKTALEVIRTLFAILALANEGRVNIEQEKIFGEIFISIIKEGL